VALCQLNPVVGDLPGNAERIIEALGVAEAAGADLAVFGELAVTGYPPEDLLLKPGFVADNQAYLAKVAAAL
jgi:NAD+ synthase (glutamine-hydrolysing)